MFEQVMEQFASYDTVIIHRHNRPDGDALGSQIGLKHILLDNFPGKRVYTVGDAPGHFGFMEDSQMDQIPDEIYEGALAVILDTSSRALISDDRYTLAARTVRIDHHLFTGRIADVEVTDSSYESCCGLIAQLALEQGLKLSPKSAAALYTGMVTDSGRFRYDATTERTFRLAAFLMEQKFDTTQIYRGLYATDLEQLQLKASFIRRIRLSEGGVAYVYTTAQELEQLGADVFTVSRGMVNTMADIRGVDIWVNFTETDRGVLCELRSSRYNINPIAVKYGGGGHAKASGATVADRDTAMAMLRDLELLTGESVC